MDSNLFFDPVRKEVRLKQKLPVFFVLDMFFKYQMFDEACRFLFYRREFNELLQLVNGEYTEWNNQCQKLKAKIHSVTGSQQTDLRTGTAG